ncbi:unnamed protein product [Ostreobium quekettii]|uniref:Transcription initiation factor IIA subunit 2 n=1 Tax=Ostreobium quekettii TaxID=121088 RepID=A0A8S1J966_9CHLO|nr:unnamed protein product [Ostreobium quekettii]|eukprot:evm.model.scf_1384.2 EVM.evm.TU.scf_1384.2   scf_1384:13570-16076(-)
MTSSFQLYRGTKIGQSLYHALFDLVEAGKLSEELSEKVLAEFDKSMYHALEERVVEKRAVIKAGLKNYRYIDNVWQFVLDDVHLRVAANGRPSGGQVEERMDCAKLVCVDSKLVMKDKMEAEGQVETLRYVGSQDALGGVMGGLPVGGAMPAVPGVQDQAYVQRAPQLGYVANGDDDAKTESE